MCSSSVMSRRISILLNTQKHGLNKSRVLVLVHDTCKILLDYTWLMCVGFYSNFTIVPSLGANLPTALLFSLML